MYNNHIERVPGHENVEGNEQADQAAKTVTSPNSILRATRMRSAQKWSIQTVTKINSNGKRAKKMQTACER